MRKLFLVALTFFGTALLLSAQKSKVIGVFQLIEKGKYAESKDIIENAIRKKSTRDWPRTWYARGVLCQEAYKKGIEKKDKNMYELYPDQLYVAYSSFEKIRRSDKKGRYEALLPPRYARLSNDLTTLGTKHYKAKEFDKAFRAYDYALRINKCKILPVGLDTNLLYNTALSAYKSRIWDQANKYLSELNTYKYSPNIPHLMYSAYMMQSDTASAYKVLTNAISNYEDNEDLVLLLVDFHYSNNNHEAAINTLDMAFNKDPINYKYPYTKGLLYQKMEQYDNAIDAYKVALTVPSDTVKVYTGIGMCYFNVGAEINAKARTISNNSRYLEEKKKRAVAYNSAVEWFEKAYKLNNNNQEVISKLNLLYKAQHNRNKLKNLKSRATSSAKP